MLTLAHLPEILLMIAYVFAMLLTEVWKLAKVLLVDQYG